MTDLELSVFTGCIMWGADSKRNTAHSLIPDDFNDRKIRSWFEILKSCQFDMGIFLSKLDTQENGEAKELLNEYFKVVIESLFDSEVERLKALASSNRLKLELSYLALSGEHNTVTVDDLYSVIADEEKKQGNISINYDYLDEYDELIEKERDCINTGFTKLDDIIGGFEIPSLNIIGARPSTGKTSFALNIAMNAAKVQYKKVLFFSLEMTSKTILDRLIAIDKAVYYGKLSRRHGLSVYDVQQSHKLTQWLRQSNFIINDNTYSIEHICSFIRKAKPDLVVVDFIQIIKTVQKFGNTREQINYISAELKRTAKDCKCVIICLSQLRRDGTTGTKPPTMADLKESGSLEADGDVVMLLHRPYVLDKTAAADNPPEKTFAIIDKNKYGRCGIMEFTFNGDFQKFYEVTSHAE